jgi:hypothetical protein
MPDKLPPFFVVQGPVKIFIDGKFIGTAVCLPYRVPGCCLRCGRVQRDEFCFWCVYEEEKSCPRS